MNRSPELLGAPESGAEKFYARKEYTTSEKLTSSFSPWGPAEGIEGPQVTVKPGPLRDLLRHCQQTHCQTIRSYDHMRGTVVERTSISGWRTFPVLR